MATPMQALEASSAAGANSEIPPSLPDPSVADLLNEMENEVFQAKQAQATHSSHAGHSDHAMPMMPQMPIGMPPMGTAGAPGGGGYGSYAANRIGDEGGLSKWIQVPHLKTAVIAMLLALLIFYPHGFFPALYQRFSRASTLEAYDLFIRIFLLGVFFYIVLVAVPY
jgi:hypothetical protein